MRKVNINHLDKQKLQQSLTSYCSEIFSNALIKSNFDSSRKSANSHRNIEIDNKSKIFCKGSSKKHSKTGSLKKKV